MAVSGTRLAIYNTFKTRKDVRTGEAERQRAIIAILAENANPTERTRTGISDTIARKHGATSKNIYSGIFRDLDEVLLPAGIAEENGRLPLKRGPRVLQEKGIPYYHLTRKGILAAVGIEEIGNRKELLMEFFAGAEPWEREFEGIICRMLEISPNFTYSIIERYVRAFCYNEIKDLLPFDLTRLRDVADNSLMIQKEVLSAFLQLSREEKKDAIRFLDKIT